jgi:type VI secretion system protein VasG
LQDHFKPAFLGRLKVIPYYPITDDNLRFITRLKLNAVTKRMRENRNTTFTYGDEVVEAIASRCTEVDSGARNIDHILSHTLLPEMSRELLSRMVDGGEIEEVKVTVGDEGFVYQVR